MTHGSLFSGIGGFDLAAEWMGWENVFHCEWNEFSQNVLKKNFPGVPLYGDIKEFNATKYNGTVDVISGGFPCQPFSTSGKRKGKDDDRYLWPEMLRVIREVQPTFVVGENVAGLTSMENGRTLERILVDLEDSSYKVEVFLLPACSVGAWHKRDRLWILAHSSSCKWTSNSIQGRNDTESIRQRPPGHSGIFENTLQYSGTKDAGNNRNNDGLSDEMDRLKALGNAIVPQVAYEIFKSIEQLNRIVTVQECDATTAK